MKPALVADVGNSRLKWGRCVDGRVSDAVSLAPDDPQAWQDQIQIWKVAGASCWAVAGVHPHRRDRLAEWLRQRGEQVQVLNSWQQLPLRVLVERPEGVGIDRLLNAVAASSRVRRGLAAILIDAGSAVTVDWLDECGAFGGGAIFPGIQLMARALHEHTALLPLVKVEHATPALPGTSTVAAIEAGVFWAAAGGIRTLVAQLAAAAKGTAEVFLTGGDGPLLAKALNPDVHLWPNMTLEGIRLAAETTP
jgi:type III pantothenate kinase